MDTSTDKLKVLLSQHNFSVTKPRLKIFSILLENHPISIKDLIFRLRDSTDRASIYRTLELFERIGVVEKLHIGWKHKYELSDKFIDHHHHAECSSCGKVFGFTEDTLLEQAIQNLGHKYLPIITTHSLEIRGICQKCYI